tara:strand:+ start:341 stop:2815 length:2475 start_codon:yes stop_codon:yes gene_type:complete
MKNNFILILIFSLIFATNFAQAFNFKTKNIEISENGNLILADEGMALSSNKDLEISANKFEYYKDLDILKTFENGKLFIKSKGLIVKFDNSIIDQKNSKIEANGNVNILYDDKGLLIKSDRITYDQIKSEIKASGNVNIEQLDRNLKINTKDINFNVQSNHIKSDFETLIEDNLKNIYIVEKFSFEIDKNILKMENLKFKSIDNNTFTTSLAFINTQTNRLFGKDVSVTLNNKYFDKNNDPRLKGNSVINNDESTTLTKGIFTTCKKRDGCPPWQLTAEEIQHDKKKKIINYKNALLRVYNVPVMYFPKFFHPDPTVKRRSGFLIPTISNSPNSDNYLNTPYFLAIAENKDATFSPRFYNNDKILLQTEYRQVNYNSNHISDFSFFTEKNKNSKNHFFYDYKKTLSLEKFSNSGIDFKIQKTSNDTYLKTNKISSNLISDINILENSLGVNLYSNDLSIDVDATIYEDLNKNNNDRYEYILPKLNLIKKIDNKTGLNGDFSFRSRNQIRNYNTNVFEKTNINDLIFSSYPNITKKGFYNNFEFLIKNSNTDSQNSSNYKENGNISLTSIFQYNSSLPLIKESDKHQKIFKPKFALKVAPPHTKDERDRDARIDVNNIYSLTRATDNDTTEGGLSLAYGSDYSIFNKEKSREVFNFKLANNLRIEENLDLPKKNQIGQKTSNFFSEITYNPNEFFTTKYNTSIKNNLSDIDYENFISEIKINNLITTFDYLNENNTYDRNSYLTNTTKYTLDKFNSLSFSTRENKTANLTEYYNLMYQYKNDCLAASIEYNKDYYTDRDLKPTESIFFKLSIIPFGETSSPNLTN